MVDPTNTDYRQGVSSPGGISPSPRLWTTAGYTNPRAVTVVGSTVNRATEWSAEGLQLRRFRFLALEEPRPVFTPFSGMSDLQQRAALCAQYY